jgi:nucleoside-specific outer membrane channel protein Tsx
MTRLSFLLLLAATFGHAAPLVAQPREINLIETLYGTGYDGRSKHAMAVVTYRHVKPWTIGDNFYFIDLTNVDNFSNAGSTYVEWGPRLSLGKTLRGEPLHFGLVRDIYLVGELNYSRNKRGSNATLLEGVSVDLGIPGFQVLKLHLERRDDPDLPGATGQVSTIYNYPFRIGRQQFAVEGFLDFVRGEGGNADALHGQPQLLWKWRPHFDLGFEWQYWHNKLGRKGFTESVVQAMVRYTF